MYVKTLLWHAYYKEIGFHITVVAIFSVFADGEISAGRCSAPLP